MGMLKPELSRFLAIMDAHVGATASAAADRFWARYEVLAHLLQLRADHDPGVSPVVVYTSSGDSHLKSCRPGVKTGFADADEHSRAHR